MKRNFFFLFLTVFVFNFSASGIKEAEQGISYYKAGFPKVAKPLLLNQYATDTLTRTESCFYLGNIYFGENKADSAAIFFKKGLIGKQLNVLNTIGLAMLKVKSNPKEADTDIQTVLKLQTSKKNPDYFIAAANAYLFNGEIDQASVYLEKAKSIKLKYSGVAVLAGDIELAKKNVGPACSNYEMAILFDPNCKEAYIKYARAYKDVNPTLSIEKLNELKAKEPTFLLVDKELADIYYAINDFGKAAELYDNYLKSGNSNVQDLTKYAMTIFLNKDYSKSLEISKMGLQKDWRNPAFNRLAMYNNVEIKKYDEAIKYADLFFNKSTNPDISYFDYTYYGQALRYTKQYNLAIQQFKNALKLDSSQVGFWKDISDMYGEIPDLKNAISSYETYMKFLPLEKKTSDIILNLGKMYYNLGSSDSILVEGKKIAFATDAKKNALLKADTLFTQVVALDPSDYRGFFYRARTNYSLDPEFNTDVAKTFYEQTLKIVEAKADTRYNPIIVECNRVFGAYYFQKKDYPQTKVYFSKILTIEPKNELAQKVILEIEKAAKGKKK
jgi:tetratricopeptide (TPR) repeat protein